MLIRRNSGTIRTLILLTKGGATTANIAAALALLSKMQTRDGGVLPAFEQRVSIRAGAFVTQPESADKDRLQHILSRLEHAKARDLSGIGVVPSLDVHLQLAHVKTAVPHI
jgi:hypothetical protein